MTDGVDAPAGGTAAPPAGDLRVESVPAEPDDLAQVVLRDLLAGALASLGACGAALASLAAFRPEDLVGRPGAALAFALGGGLGAGAAFAAAELTDGLVARRLTARRLPRALAAGLALGLLSPLAPLGGAFELLLVEGGSSVEAAKLVATALDRVRPAELPALVGFALALGLPLLATRRLGWAPSSQAAATAAVAAALFAGCLLLGPWGLALPVATLASLLLGGAVAAPAALALADRLVRRARGRPAPAVAPGARRRRLVAGAVLAALALPLASLAGLPGVRASRLRLWLLAALTTEPARLGELHDASRRVRVHEGSTPATAGKPRTVTRGTPIGPPALSGLDLDAVAQALDLWLPPEGERAQRRILERAAAAGAPRALHDLGSLLLAEEAVDEGRRLLLAAARAGELAAASELVGLPLSAAELPGLDAAFLAHVRDDRPGWVAGADQLWEIVPLEDERRRGAPDRPDLGRLSSLLLARAELGDVRALPGLEAAWRAGHRRPELEACFARWAALGARVGSPELAWRAVELLVRLAEPEEASPDVVAAAFAAARRHAAVETARARVRPGTERWLEPTRHVGRRVLLTLLVARPGRRLREDEDRLPFAAVEVARLGFSLDDSLRVARAQASPSAAVLRAALAATPPLPGTTGPGAEALRATTGPGPRQDALELALAALARDPRDADAHRALARLDLARALDGRRLDDGAGVGTSFAYAWPIDQAAVSRAEAHLSAALALDPACAGGCLERALVIAAAEDGEWPTRATEVHAWLALGDRLAPPGSAAPAKAALRRYLRETEAQARGLGSPLEVAALQRAIVERWRLAARDPAALQAIESATRRDPRKGP